MTRRVREEHLVPLAAIAGRLGGTVGMVLDRLAAEGRPEPVTDWRGELAVGSEVATRVVAAYEQEIQAEEARRAAYAAYEREREARRAQVAQEVFERVSREAMARTIAKEEYAAFVNLTGPAPGPQERAAGRAAAAEAVREFDAKNPLVALEQFER